VGLEWGPLSLVTTIEELLERRSSGSDLESREYGSTIYSQKLALTSPTSGGRSVVIVRSRTQATELFITFTCYNIYIFNENERTSNWKRKEVEEWLMCF
jgi:hypothetical protein